MQIADRSALKPNTTSASPAGAKLLFERRRRKAADSTGTACGLDHSSDICLGGVRLHHLAYAARTG
jgi:hypothetical protein